MKWFSCPLTSLVAVRRLIDFHIFYRIKKQYLSHIPWDHFEKSPKHQINFNKTVCMKWRNVYNWHVSHDVLQTFASVIASFRHGTNQPNKTSDGKEKQSLTTSFLACAKLRLKIKISHNRNVFKWLDPVQTENRELRQLGCSLHRELKEIELHSIWSRGVDLVRYREVWIVCEVLRAHRQFYVKKKLLTSGANLSHIALHSAVSECNLFFKCDDYTKQQICVALLSSNCGWN